MDKIVVTGGASGMGRALVELLSKSGYYVYSLDIKKGVPLENVYQIETDVTNMESVEKAYDIVKSQTENLVAIVNFAGIIMMDSLVEMEESAFLKIFDVNVFGAFRVNKVFLPLILKNKGKIIITTSELAGTKILPFNAIYSITKKALDNYAEGLRLELGLIGIPVVTIRPGAVKTNLLEKSTSSMEKLVNNTVLYKEKTSRFKKIVDSQQGGAIPAERIAELVLKIIKNPKPKAIYSKNVNMKLKMLKVVPSSLLSKVLKKMLTKKPKQKETA